ncbi:FAD binding domain-containing protein [Rhodocollybia butyracea]|uniref:FAD binding domain-containing protein n=1 Tax=Rhodocollybia butyracea TaxID=206335 RepID=A0A9P5PMA8_9AGAR|nr:FAD binding domain-containing protein [Rhodocollybia butyracea]
MSQNNVLIVGAGPTGLSLALLLLRNGLSVRIIEKQLQFHPGERGAGIMCRTLELYKLLGILPEILKQSTPCAEYIGYRSSPDDGKPSRIAPFMEHIEDTPARPMHNPRMLGQNLHQQILREHILADYGVEVELGTELRSFEQYADHVVAHTVKTLDSKEENFNVDWLIGADGARSVVRKHLGLTFFGETPTEMEAVIGDIHVVGDSVKDDQILNGWTIWGQFNSGIAVSMRAVPGQNLFSFIIRSQQGLLDVDKLASSREELIKLFYEVTGRTDIQFGELVGMGVWRPNIRMVNEFGKGRVFVAGDASHVHSPTGAQGMNSGVQDSFNLAWKLALVHKGLSPQSILGSYSQERLRVIASTLNKTTELFAKEFSGKQQQTQPTQYFTRGYELRMLGINYRDSTLVLDEKNLENDTEAVDAYRSGDNGMIQGGDRAPDAPSLTHLGHTIGTTLFDIFKSNHHTALIFPGSGDQVCQVRQALETFREYPAGLVKTVLILPGFSCFGILSELSDMAVVDTKGYAHKSYAIEQDEATVVIVRPDGYIGALVTSGSTGIRAYFSRILL